jgi:hypothetical protein
VSNRGQNAAIAEKHFLPWEATVQAMPVYGGREIVKTSLVSLALGVLLAIPVAAYASETPYGQVHKYRTVHHTTRHTMRDPFKPRITNGLSSNRNACASYGCVGAGGGGD